MRRFSLLALLTSAIIFASFIILPRSALAFSGGGSGTVIDPYEIYTCDQLLEINDNLTANYELENDIDCTGVTYNGIGASGPGLKFTGNFDGKLQTISNITSTTALGVFNWTNGATIENIKLSANSFDNASFYIGSAVGSVDGGTIRNIRADDSNSLTNSGGGTGGIVGYSVGTVDIDRTYYNGTITYGGSYNGGVLGLVNGGATTIDNSFSNATLTGSASYTGGLVGSVNGGTLSTTNSYAAVIFSYVHLYNGGLVGGLFNGGTVTNSFSASDMTAAVGTNSGAMFGLGDGTSTNNSFDEYLANRSNCTGNGTAACTAENTANAEPNYFKNNNVNSPLDLWDFDLLWKKNASDYPTFATFGAVQIDTPETTTNSINFGYNFVGVSGSGPLSSPEIRYRKANSSDQWIYLSNVENTNYDLTISGLSSATTYEIQIRAAFDGVGEYTDWTDGQLSATTLAAQSSVTESTESDTLADTGMMIREIAIISGLILVTSLAVLIISKINVNKTSR